jgi:hypothetical protein
VNKKKKKKKLMEEEEEAMKKEEHKNEGKEEIVNMAQVKEEEWCKAIANVDNTRVHNAALQIAHQFLTKPSPGLLASTVLVKSLVETSQEPLILSTYQLYIH